MPETLLPLAIQIPLVAAFMWFVLEIMKRQAAASKERDDKLDIAQNMREGNWREFLREERTQNNEATARLAEEIKRIAERLEANTTLLVAHDASVRPAIQRIMAERQ